MEPLLALRAMPSWHSRERPLQIGHFDAQSSGHRRFWVALALIVVVFPYHRDDVHFAYARHFLGRWSKRSRTIRHLSVAAV